MIIAESEVIDMLNLYAGKDGILGYGDRSDEGLISEMHRIYTRRPEKQKGS